MGDQFDWLGTDKVALWRQRYDDGTYPDDFWEWLSVNGHILDEFIRIGLKTKRAGITRWSSDAICHVLRWQTAMREKGQNLVKINNNATAGLSRLAMQIEPKLAGFFQTRSPPAHSHGRRLNGQLYTESRDESVL